MAMSLELLIGAPIAARAWIMPRWFEHVERSSEKAGVVPTYLFVVPDHDDATLATLPMGVDIIKTRETFREDIRDWCSARFSQMVWLRNLLLQRVRFHHPDFFLSLDSDILVHEDLVANLLESASSFDAVGGRTYMSAYDSEGRGQRFVPSLASYAFNGGVVHRSDTCGVLPMDVIMAIKLMNAAAYNVDYEYSDLGEDFGICAAWQRRGVKVGFDGRCINKHVMARELLDVVDERVGF